VKVEWTDTALAHLEDIYAYISQTSKRYADAVVDKITSRSIQIADFPYSGRKVPELNIDQIREIYEAPYRIIYYIKPDGIEVLAVVHSRQDISGISSA
jgi:toxin ParE1/3/4